jgi:hypothetical protein
MHFLTTKVERMLSDRRSFDEIEDRIEAMPVSDDKKAALWLLAWSGQAERVRRRTVDEVLTATAQAAPAGSHLTEWAEGGDSLR